MAISISAASLIAALITVATSSTLICTPYVTTVVRMEALAAGDTTAAINFSDHRDCVGRMARAMATFRNNAIRVDELGHEQEIVVSSLSSGLDKLVERDLEFNIHDAFPKTYEGLRSNYNAAVQSLASSLRSVHVGASKVHQTIGEICEATDDLAARNQKQSGRLAQIAVTMTSVTGLVRETASGALAVQQSITAANTEACEGGEVVRRAITAMAAIENSAQEIGQIISVIDGIAFQTNLLALNAGVEAARAGEAGRGFAVVATEVRALAQRSADAAQSIKTLITTSGQQVATGVELVGQSGDKLGQIVRRVSEITVLIDTIASSASLQSQNLSEVTIAMAEMERMTQQNSAMVEQSSAATRSLSTEAESITKLVKTFRTRDQAGRPVVLARPDSVRRSSALEAERAPARETNRGWQGYQPASSSSVSTPSLSRMPQHIPAQAKMTPPAASNLALKAQASGDWSEF